jgi:hypothetical protein
MKTFAAEIFVGMLLCLSAAAAEQPALDLTTWTPRPAEWKPKAVTGGTADLSYESWGYLVSPDKHESFELSASIRIESAARHLQFFGASWSAWPDPTYSDGGFDAGLLLRGDKDSGYRVQLSHKYQVVALVKFPEGGYVRVAPCKVKLNEPHRISASIQGSQIIVQFDGKEKIRWDDTFLPLEQGQYGISVSSGAKVSFSEIRLAKAATSISSQSKPHVPSFSVRKFLGERQWIFDGDEPILQLHSTTDPSCFAKLKPGYKPQLTFDSHWGLENQGAFPEGASKWTEPVVTGSGKSLEARWSARGVKERFVTQSTLTVGFDSRRGTYTYDIDSELEVLPGEPFHFRYGFDFEHHTPLDPFRWQYLVARQRGGEMYHRPVYPIDPGGQNDLETYHGMRVWYGRHNEKMHFAPAVEYDIQGDWNRDPEDPSKLLPRKLNTAVCAAFYDTGVAFEPEIATPGTKLRVKYRYTGYPADEAERVFEQSKIYDSPTLDPNHHYIFADEWPKLTFSEFVPLSKTWIYGRTPFMSGHNQRPTYALEKNCGAGSGFAMKLGPASFGKATLPIGSSLAKGRYIVNTLVKSVNAHGEGGRIELEASQAKTNKVLLTTRHFIGNGSFDWQRQAFAFDLAEDAGALAIAFGNAGTGEMLVAECEFKRLADGEALPSDVASRPNNAPPKTSPAPAGAIADYRMEEGRGHHVLNYANGNLGHLDLANIEWAVDARRPALRFADNVMHRKDYLIDSQLSRNYLSHPGYAGRGTLPVALAGHHGGGEPIKGLTLAAWIKPAAEMGASEHGSKGDVIGFGARRFILSLHGQKAPYQLAARINVNDTVEAAETKLTADRWTHVAMTCEPFEGQWQVRLYQDGQAVGHGVTKKFAADSVVVPSLILGAEIFYFHDAYYRGLIGHTLVFERALTPTEVAVLVKGP